MLPFAFSSPITQWLRQRKVETFIVFCLLIVSTIIFSINLFHFPYYENDEGVYMSQAWSSITQGKLAPYTYWYDHAPLGWWQISIWSVLSGGFFSFGNAINSGRVFMAIVHATNTALVYLIAKRFTRSRVWATTALILYAFSPLSIFLQRRVLLDNIVTTWFLLSLYFVTAYKQRFYHLFFSGLTLGIAILSKESVIFFAPVLAYFALAQAHRHHKLQAVVLWCMGIGICIGMYISYAIFKNEFFPSGTLPWDNTEHVSVIETLKFQASRGGGNVFDLHNSDFWIRFTNTWVYNDPLLIYTGLFCIMANLLIGFRHLHARILALLGLAFLFFLGRGGIVLDFYIIPLLPILVLNIVYLVYLLDNPFRHRIAPAILQSVTPVLPVVMIVLWLFQFYAKKDAIGIEKFSLYHSDQTKPQIEALEWIRTHLSPNDYLVFDNYAYLELRARTPIFSNADWYIKVDTDKEIKNKFNNNPENIDYLALTPQIEQDIASYTTGLPLIESAFKNSREITTFYNDRWRVKIMGQLTPRRMTDSSYRSLLRKFTNEGAITWYKASTEEYLLLMELSLAKNDQETFLQINNTAEQFMTFTTRQQAQYASLQLRAAQQWENTQLQEKAQTNIDQLKSQIQNWKGYQLPVKKSSLASATIELNQLTPDYYAQFAKTKDAAFWTKSQQDTYRILTKCLADTKSKLPASTCDLTTAGGSLQATFYYPVFDQNTLPLLQHIANDARFNQTPEARKALQSFIPLVHDWLTSYKVTDTYSNTANSLSDQESYATYLTLLPMIYSINPEKGKELYDLKFKETFKEDAIQTWWGNDPDNLTVILQASLATLDYQTLSEK